MILVWDMFYIHDMMVFVKASTQKSVLSSFIWKLIEGWQKSYQRKKNALLT